MYDEKLPEGGAPEEELLPGERPRTGASVIRLRLGRLDLETFPPLLMEHAGLLKLEAKTVCVQGGGILADNLEPARAQALAAAVQAAGEPCFVAPAGKMAPLPRAVPVHAARPHATDLGPVDQVGRQDKAPWDKAVALAMAGVGVERQERKVSRDDSFLTRRVGTAGAMSIGGVAGVAISVSGAVARSALSGDTVQKTEERVWLDLVFLHPLRRYRIDSGQFDYSLLGDQLAMTGEANVQTLARWFLHWAPQMVTNVDAAELAAKGRVRLPHLAEKPYNEMVHWLINLAKFGKRPER